MVNVSFLQELLNTVAEQGRQLLPWVAKTGDTGKDIAGWRPCFNPRKDRAWPWPGKSDTLSQPFRRAEARSSGFRQ